MSNSQQMRIFLWAILTAVFVLIGFTYSLLFFLFASLTGVLVLYLIIVPDQKKQQSDSVSASVKLQQEKNMRDEVARRKAVRIKRKAVKHG